MSRLWGLAMTALLLAPAPAAAELQWQYRTQQGRPYLQAMPSEPEGDTEFWASCRSATAIEVGIGANTTVGEGKGETVSLTLTSGGVSATVSGQSRNSANFQMTVGTELRTTVSRGHALFKVLATGQPITASGSIKKVTWPVKGLKTKLAAFLAACK